jgi:hypothetical protein
MASTRMDKCIQFKGLSPLDRARVLEMAKRSLAFWSFCECHEPKPERDEVCWLIDQAAEHLNHMNALTGGKYGDTTLDV